MIGETNINGGAGLDGKGALLKIKSRTGSTITVSKGNYSKMIKVSQLDQDNDKYSYWFFQTTDFGEWIVTATDGTNTETANISITTEGQYEVLLSYAIYIVQAGQLILTPTVLTHVSTPTSSGGYVDFAADGNYYCLVDFGPIDCTGRSEIIIDVGAGSTSWIDKVMMPSIGFSDSTPNVNQSTGVVSPYDKYTKMTGANYEVTPGKYIVPLSDAGSQHIWLAFSGSSGGYTRTMHISNFYVD